MARRPPSDEGRKVALNMRTTQDVRDKLEASAASSGRSLTHEVEFRVYQSLELDNKMGGSLATSIYVDIGRLLQMLPIDAFHGEPYLARAALSAGIERLIEWHFMDRGGLMSPQVPRDAERLTEAEALSRQIAGAVLASSSLHDMAAQAKVVGADYPRFGESLVDHATRAGLFDKAKSESPLAVAPQPASAKRSNKKIS